MRRAVFLVLAGCLQADLVPCGDLLCPVGTVCVDHVACATEDEIDACLGIDDGDVCHTSAGNGHCAHRVCAQTRCGDGLVEVGEACDDGNAISGDGCRGDCMSDETCGNGVLDVGEHCDCGRDELTQPSGCPTANIDDASALCDPACTRFCGDGVITGSEQCDGGAVSLACTDVGYYSGASSCSPFCTLDFSTCEGRCGDGVVQDLVGEECDGGVPPGTCVDYGRDFGLLGCNSSCTPDIAGTCERFGWKELVSGSVDAIAANVHGHVALMSGMVRTVWDATASSRTNPGWSLVTADTARVVAAGATSLGWFDGTWHELAVGVGTSIAIAVHGDQLYSISADCTFTSITLSTGTMSSPGGAPSTTCTSLVAAADGSLYTAGGAAGILEFAGSWSVASAALATELSPGATGQIALPGETFDVATKQRLTRPAYASGPGFGVGIDGDSVLTSWLDDSFTTYYDFHAGAVAWSEARVIDMQNVTRSAEGMLIVYGYSGASLRGPMVGASGAGMQVAQMSVGADDALFLCGDNIAWYTEADAQTRSSPGAGGCSALLGDPRGEHLVANPQGVWRYDPIGGTYTNEHAGNATQLAGTVQDPWAIVDNTVMHDVTSTWTAVPMCSDAELLGGGGNAPIYATSRCDEYDYLYRYDTDWTFVATDGFNDGVDNNAFFQRLYALTDGTSYVVSGSLDGSQVLRIDTTGLTHLTGGGSGAVAGTSATDTFIATSGSYVHEANGRTSRVTAPSASPLLAVTRRHIYSYASGVLYVITRMPSVVVGL